MRLETASRSRSTPTNGNACLRHLTVLFLLLAGLADGLAPKERRYAGCDSPNYVGPPLPFARHLGGKRYGNSAVRTRDATSGSGEARARPRATPCPPPWPRTAPPGSPAGLAGDRLA